MSVRLTVGTQVIDFPSSGQDPNWAPAVIQFAQAVTDQLSSIASQFDISPRVQILTTDANSNIVVNSVVFPSGSVRSFTFNYAIYRTNGSGGGTTTLAENGTVSGVYKTTTATWALQHEFDGVRQSGGLPYHTFSMSGDQLLLSTVAIGGAYDGTNSKISYGASTILVSDI